MSDLSIDIEWEDPLGARGPELRATWGRVRIAVGDEVITQVFDKKTGTVRSAIYLPLYPLAEWLATHWWFLRYEMEAPGRSVQQSYAQRHDIHYAQEGYALPHLTIRPLGETTALEWEAHDSPHHALEFLSRGAATLPAETLEEKLRDLITAVIERLQTQGISETPLQQEWSAILQADTDEHEFCAVAASLGVDPYGLAPNQQKSLVAAAEKIPRELWFEFFATAEVATLGRQVKSLRQEISKLDDLADVTLPRLRQFRERVFINLAASPWKEGAALAQHLRTELNIRNRIIRSIDDLGSALKLNRAALNRSIIPASSANGFFDALVGENAEGSPGFILGKRREDQRLFALCRALFEFLVSPPGSLAIVSRARSERQKRNRAFAAEFLAPVHLLRPRISGAIGPDDIDDLAGEFGVSTYVIWHQIENHNLARFVPD